MTWIDKALERKRQADNRGSKISRGAVVVYQNLVAEIRERVNEALRKEQGLHIFTDPAHSQEMTSDLEVRVVRSGETKALRITLSEDERFIDVSGAKSLKFELGVYGEQVVLKHDGKQVKIPRAAQLILEPFLYPD